MRLFRLLLGLVIFFSLATASAQTSSELQPFIFQTERLVETLDFLGAPISTIDKKNIETIIAKNSEEAITDLQNILDSYTLFQVEVNPESRVKVKQGLAKPALQQYGWSTFLIKAENQAGITAILEVLSEQAKRNYDGGEKIYGL